MYLPWFTFVFFSSKFLNGNVKNTLFCTKFSKIQRSNRTSNIMFVYLEMCSKRGIPKIYLPQELRASSLAVNLEKMASHYRNCGTIEDVTSLWRVCNGVKCDMVHRRLKVKNTLRYIFDTWSSHVRSQFIISSRFFTFWCKSMQLPPRKI
jgi:hypothetical protein